MGGLNVYRAFGDHHRQVFAMKSLEELRGTPRATWNAFDEWRFAYTYVIYPNTTFLGLCAPVAVARAAGLRTARIDESGGFSLRACRCPVGPELHAGTVRSRVRCVRPVHC